MKKSNAEFIQLSIGFCHKLADEKASGTVRTLVDALTETWFNTGRHNRHLNPFPLELCDTGEWGLTRLQKCRALKFLVRVKLIAVDRRDPKEPFVTLAWVNRYPSDTSHGGGNV
jgi:hypothetical protein